ncbi:MAG: hypothetical protein JNJ45_03785 [Chthonomonas sp.]|nr:hypothetical protein [Chthonomonas sp.]
MSGTDRNQEYVREFTYHAWANDLWVAAAPNLPFADQANDILRHIAMAQNRWLGRCWNEDEQAPEEPDTAAWLSATNARWREFIAMADIEAFINWEREGKVMYLTLEDIVRQLINHGNYHRGELRGLCRAHGVEEFPETDFARYVMQIEN